MSDVTADPTAGFKEALACWASGVSVVATSADGLVYGLTVSSFTSLSLDPPLVLVCINNSNRLPSMVEQARRFTVSILAADQEGVSNLLARRGREPSVDLGVPSEWTASDQPVVAGAAAWLDCALHTTIVEGDHTILIGRVVQTRADAAAAPLLYWRRGYRAVADG